MSRFCLPIYTYAPWGVRADGKTKSSFSPVLKMNGSRHVLVRLPVRVALRGGVRVHDAGGPFKLVCTVLDYAPAALKPDDVPAFELGLEKRAVK